MDRSISMLPGERRADIEARFDARYEELFAAIEAEERAEYDQHFDQAFQAKHPFTPNLERIRQQALAKLAAEQDDSF